MTSNFPKCVIVIIGTGYTAPDTPNWSKDGAIWLVSSQQELNTRIMMARSTLAQAVYNDHDDDGQEWSEIVRSTTHYLVDDFIPCKYPDFNLTQNNPVKE